MPDPDTLRCVGEGGKHQTTSHWRHSSPYVFIFLQLIGLSPASLHYLPLKYIISMHIMSGYKFLFHRFIYHPLQIHFRFVSRRPTGLLRTCFRLNIRFTEHTYSSSCISLLPVNLSSTGADCLPMKIHVPILSLILIVLSNHCYKTKIALTARANFFKCSDLKLVQLSNQGRRQA